MDVTPSKRSQVVSLRQHSGLSIRLIVNQLGIAKSTLVRIVKAADEDGDISIHYRGRYGRKKETTSHNDKMIIRNQDIKSPWKTSKELQNDLATSVVFIDPSIICRRLLASGGLQGNPSKSNC